MVLLCCFVGFVVFIVGWLMFAGLLLLVTFVVALIDLCFVFAGFAPLFVVLLDCCCYCDVFVLLIVLLCFACVCFLCACVPVCWTCD